MIEFEVLGEPQGKGRHRTAFMKNGRITNYTPKKTKDYETLVGQAYKLSSNGKFFENEVFVEVVAEYGIPKAYNKEKTRQALAKEIRPTKKPDCDNVLKIVLDGLNKVAYKDDAQVVFSKVEKVFSTTPKVRVKIYEEQRG